MMKEQDWSLHDLLRSMGLNRTYLGYPYLIHSLELARKDPGCLDLVTKRIYPEVAKKFETSDANVDGALRTAVRVCWQRGPWELTGRSSERETPPSVKLFLRRLAQLDRQNQAE